MLTPSLRASTPHARRGARVPPIVDPQLLCHRRHAVLVAAHRAMVPPGPPHWLRWFEDRPQPCRKVT